MFSIRVWVFEVEVKSNLPVHLHKPRRRKRKAGPMQRFPALPVVKKIALRAVGQIPWAPLLSLGHEVWRFLTMDPLRQILMMSLVMLTCRRLTTSPFGAASGRVVICGACATRTSTGWKGWRRPWFQLRSCTHGVSMARFPRTSIWGHLLRWMSSVQAVA